MNTCKIEGITYITADEPKGGGCKGCAGEKDSVLCRNFLDKLGCHTHKIIWLKKEDTVVKAIEEITFTESQITYLSEVFGIDATEEVLTVSDGFVKKSGKVWWKYQFGPEHVEASKHWDNVKDCPDLYSVKEPTYKVVYESNIS
jgi:hypothetical protein